MKNAGIIPKPIFGHMVLENDLVLQNVFQMWFHPCHSQSSCLQKPGKSQGATLPY